LATAVATGDPIRVVGDLRDTCLDVGADLVVARKLSSFGLTNLAIPHQFDPAKPRRIVALVGSGPHSLLAAEIALALSGSMRIPTELVTAYFEDTERAEATRALETIAAEVGLEGTLVRVDDVGDLIKHAGDDALLVLGAAGGSLLQRTFFGACARLRARAPSGAIVVRAAPDRVFRHLREPVYVGARLKASDAARLVRHPLVAVVEDGLLVGLLDRSSLVRAPGAIVEDLMGEPLSASREDLMSDLEGLLELFGGGPVPVTDREGRLIGSVMG
ncbi:MAG TPA: hypothetical protein VIL12_00055, partial [Acidimicrobiia bacterium]